MPTARINIPSILMDALRPAAPFMGRSSIARRDAAAKLGRTRLLAPCQGGVRELRAEARRQNRKVASDKARNNTIAKDNMHCVGK